MRRWSRQWKISSAADSVCATPTDTGKRPMTRIIYRVSWMISAPHKFTV
ncbi:MAG: hypothetical protein DCC59_12390 [Chloroflexi bacterium]|nr:MAG: hypothetical protein DCC59_12390 [Chloroflexota bacterium]